MHKVNNEAHNENSNNKKWCVDKSLVEQNFLLTNRANILPSSADISAAVFSTEGQKQNKIFLPVSVIFCRYFFFLRLSLFYIYISYFYKLGAENKQTLGQRARRTSPRRYNGWCSRGKQVGRGEIMFSHWSRCLVNKQSNPLNIYFGIFATQVCTGLCCFLVGFSFSSSSSFSTVSNDKMFLFSSLIYLFKLNIMQMQFMRAKWETTTNKLFTIRVDSHQTARDSVVGVMTIDYYACYR